MMDVEFAGALGSFGGWVFDVLCFIERHDVELVFG